MTKCVALVVAAGRGARFGGDIPKQYRKLGGQFILRRTLDALLSHPAVDGALVVYHPDDQPLYAEATQGLDLPPPQAGGATRQESVRLGLNRIAELYKDASPETVLIHDAARPFVSHDIITDVLTALNRTPGALPALMVSDTLKRGHDGMVSGTESRDGLWRAQTPQGFHFSAILDVHEKYKGMELTDDVALFEKSNLSVALCAGSEDNFKITHEHDLERAEMLLSANHQTRTASGFDVHRFGEGDQVTLCGVSIPHTCGLEGHSDADVGLHALTDALLGTVAAGDIGDHFPPSDAQFKDMDSARFVSKAVQLIAERGGKIIHVDVTLILETPKISPHKAEMIEKISNLLGIDKGAVSVKATTTEGLGFCGRGEGIAAQALASVALPA